MGIWLNIFCLKYCMEFLHLYLLHALPISGFLQTANVILNFLHYFYLPSFIIPPATVPGFHQYSNIYTLCKESKKSSWCSLQRTYIKGSLYLLKIFLTANYERHRLVLTVFRRRHFSFSVVTRLRARISRF